MTMTKQPCTALPVVMALTGFMMVLPPAPATAAGFDCARASSKIEKTICNTPVLDRADDELARLYQLAVKADPAIKAEQRGWIKQRNSCGDADCLASLYGARLVTLEAGLERPAKPAGALVLTVAAQPDLVEASLKTRLIDVTLPGRIIFGPDPRVGNLALELGNGAAITIVYMRDVTDGESPVLERYIDQDVPVEISGTLEVFDDGTAQFTRGREIAIYSSRIMD